MANVTNARVIQDRLVGFAWQTAEGSAATSPDDLLLVRSGQIDPQSNKVRPQGTHGSVHRRKDGIKETHKVPVAELLIFGTRLAALAMLRSATMSAPTSLSSSSDFATTGTGGVTFTSFTGVAPKSNVTLTTGGKPKLFYTTTGTASTRTVSIYQESGLSTLVAQATGLSLNSTGNAISAVGGSLLSGKVNISGSSADTTGSVTFSTLRPQFGKRITEYFTLFDDDGQKLWRIDDCVVSSIEFQASESENLMLAVEIMGQTFNDPTTGGTITGSVGNLSPYEISELTVTRDPGGGSSGLLQVSNITLSVAHTTPNGGEIRQFVGNADSPKLIKTGRTMCGISFESVLSDEMQNIWDDAESTTFTKLRFDFTEGSNTLRFDAENPEYDPSALGFSDEVVDDFATTGEGFFDGTTEPFVISIGF